MSREDLERKECKPNEGGTKTIIPKPVNQKKVESDANKT